MTLRNDLKKTYRVAIKTHHMCLGTTIFIGLSLIVDEELKDLPYRLGTQSIFLV